ncbi:hypothetical protein GCM10009087_30390 [Sphingomonas oligophenolica]
MIAGVGGARLDRPSLTAAEAPIKARGCPPIFCENRFPPRPLRGAPLRSAALTAAPPPVFFTMLSIRRTEAKEMIMGMFQPISVASDRVIAALVSGLEIEFGHGVGEALAHRFLEAEETDFLWDARDQERWIGAYESTDDEEIDLDRVRIFGRLDGRWFVAVMIVDGDGNAHGVMGKREFGRRKQALAAFADA